MLKKEYDELKSSTDIDKRSALHQAFRDLLLAKTGDIPAIEILISFARLNLGAPSGLKLFKTFTTTVNKCTEGSASSC
ncbi:hypothetical protein pipiens_002968 [Culex pipiens pipiens]|uniref:Uncharacterized protein n=1 Tax=Culex pipiens pipiens TaxID=38569 RepID=A0ABD1D5H1_CULPP